MGYGQITGDCREKVDYISHDTEVGRIGASMIHGDCNSFLLFLEFIAIK